MAIGIDILDLQEFTKALQNGGQTFLNNHFHLSELKDTRPEHLAGIFSVKEATFKTGYLPKLDFLKVQIINDPHGKPIICDLNGQKITELSISISHSKDTVVSVAVWTV